MIKRLLHSDFVTHYGSVFVLLLLCGYYSYATYSEQHPITQAAGTELGKRIANEVDDGGVLIVIRETTGDQEFATAIEKELKRLGVTVLGIISGTPADLRQRIERLGVENKKLDVIATHQPGTAFGPLRERTLNKLKGKYPSLSSAQVIIPKSYYWPTFLTRENIINVINQNADVAIIAIGMTMVIITAGIDLSVGSLLAIAAVITAISLESFGGANASVVVMIGCGLLGVLSCAACGLFNGVMVTWFRVPAFIVTLATLMIARGLALILAVRYQSSLTGGRTEGTPESITIQAEAFSWLGNGEVFGIPNPILLMLALYFVAHYVMSQTAFGRYVYAVGGNPEAARLSGVPVVGVLIAVYIVCATMAGIGGVVDASRFEGGRPNAGDLYELQVIAAVVVGGTSLAGGEGKIFGTLIGAMIIAVIQNGLNMAGVKSYEQKVVFGGLILAAVILDQLKKRR
ncbi:ABC transporter permease [Thalassoglobus polymorphus]|uniref:Ribose transport system permease protein RbsC n=1 Tax=Thalassoglobus polymorphus TaxID=2527994 RepID=A0A517QMH4_9PLAN|nr:ABC transporter permease [Thalassoglobus polymorphus]QDT32838.1 Ribose transport system permease protein RbsC [Thalassoglobus polymorphus]